MRIVKKQIVKTPAGSPAAALNEQSIRRVRKDLPKEEILFDLADFYKVFGDTTRIKILECLRRADLCVGELAAVLGASPSAVSHQLKILRLSNLVKARKTGKVVYYALSDFHVSDILERGLDHVMEPRARRSSR